MMIPEDFNKSFKEWDEARKSLSLANYTRRVMIEFVKDSGGPLEALRLRLKQLGYGLSEEELATGVKSAGCGIPEWFHVAKTAKTAPDALLRNAPTTPAVKAFYKALQRSETGRAAVVFPLLATGNWVAHNLKVYDMPGSFAVCVTTAGTYANYIRIQSLKSFSKEIKQQ